MGMLSRGLRGRTGGAPALERIRGFGLCLDWPSTPTCYTQFFTDWVHQCAGWGVYNNSDAIQSVTQSASTGWPGTNQILATWHMKIFLFNSLGSSYTEAYLRPTTYKARLRADLQAAGWTVQFVDSQSTGFLSASAAGGTCTGTISDQGTGGWGGMLLTLWCIAPATGGPYTFDFTTGPPVQIYQQSQETRMDVGDDASYFDLDFLNDVGGKVRLIRCKDWAGIDTPFYNWELNPPGSGQFDRRKRNICNYNELTQSTWFTWQMATWAAPSPNTGGVNYQGNANVPYKIQAKLAKVLAALNPDGKCGLFLHFPLMTDAVSCDVRAAGATWIAYNHDFANGDMVALGGANGYNQGGLPSASFLPGQFYYIVNAVPFVSFSLSATSGGAAITIPSDQNNGINYNCLVYKVYTDSQTQALYDAIANEVFTEAPNIDIVSDVGNENWNGAQPYGFDQCFYALTMQNNRSALNYLSHAAGYSWALRRAWKAVEKKYPRTQHVRIFQGQAVFFNGMAGISGGYDFVDPTSNDFGNAKTVDLLDAHCCAPYVYGALQEGQYKAGSDSDFTTMGYALNGSNYNYWGNQQYLPAGSYAGQPPWGERVHNSDGTNYECILTTTGNAPPNATFWKVLNPNGLNTSATTWTTAQLLLYCLYSNSQAQFYQTQYKTLGDAMRNASLAPLGYICYEGGPIQGNTSFNLGVSVPTFGALWHTFMRTDSFRLAIQDYFNKCIKGSGVTTVCQYMYAGQWRNNSSTNADTVAYGMKRAHSEPDTLASAWFKIGTNVQ